MSESNRDPKPLVPHMFYYPIDGRQMICQRLYETAHGVVVRILDDDEMDSQPYFINKRYYDAIAALETVSPGINPPCDCKRESVVQSPTIPQA